MNEQTYIALIELNELNNDDNENQSDSPDLLDFCFIFQPEIITQELCDDISYDLCILIFVVRRLH